MVTLRCLSTLLFTFLLCSVSAQTAVEHEVKADSLDAIYGKNKTILAKYRLASLVALSYYPSLADERIRFELKGINSTARTTMTLFSIFRKINKQYIIYINDDRKKTGILLDDAPFEAQVGLLAHELAHVLDYNTRSFFEMTWWGIKYALIKQQEAMEKGADRITISHGAGWPLYAWATFVLENPSTKPSYLRMKKQRYLSPAAILQAIRK